MSNTYSSFSGSEKNVTREGIFIHAEKSKKNDFLYSYTRLPLGETSMTFMYPRRWGLVSGSW